MGEEIRITLLFAVFSILFTARLEFTGYKY